jgi:hypothetical protein
MIFRYIRFSALTRKIHAKAYICCHLMIFDALKYRFRTLLYIRMPAIAFNSKLRATPVKLLRSY